MASIFDNMMDQSQEFGGETATPAGKEGRFTVQFGTEHVQVPVRAGMTIKDAFITHADYLGFDPDRTMAYRDNHNNLLDGNEAPEVGVVYTASITHDEKGL